MVSTQLVSIFLLALFCHRQVLSELLSNPDFEDASLGDWSGIGLRIDTDAFSGHQSVKVFRRSGVRNGPSQSVRLKPSTKYRVSGYVKLLSDRRNQLFQMAYIIITYKYSDGSTNPVVVVRRGRLTSTSGWTLLQGAFKTPAKGYLEATVSIRGPLVNFLVDRTSLKILWKAEANDRIEKYRKTDVTLNVQLATGLNPQNYEVEVKQVSQAFPFGTLVSDTHLLDPAFKPYQDVLFGLFNWFTVGTYKWDLAQGTPANPNYDRATQATDFIRRKGFSVRAHNMFWGIEEFVPEFVRDLSKRELKTAVENRVKFLTRITSGKVEHWDVINQLLIGTYFEERTGESDFGKKIISMVSRANPNFKLFLNERDAVGGGSRTRAYVDLALKIKNANVGLHGLGVTGHFDPGVTPEPECIMERLDLLATAGLPLWISELDLVAEDEKTRAELFETVLTLFFSHPSVEGITLWGFWSRTQNAGPQASLMSGNSYYINKAGQRFIKLLKEIWSTRFTYPVSKGSSFKFRGFQGSYEIIVKKKGRPVKLGRFTLGKSAATVIVVINGREQPIDVPVHPVIPPFVTRQFPHTDYEVGRETLAIMRSSPSFRLRCVNRVSDLSPVGDDERATVSCQHGEVMTSCSMLTEDNSDIRDGEAFETSHGNVVCVGINGFGSTAAVRAQARCCRLTGLTCEIAKSGPTPIPASAGDRAKTTCSHGRIPTGCTSFSFHVRAIDGALHQAASCIAQIDDYAYPPNGVFSTASCCSSSRLRCRRVRSFEGARLMGSTVGVSCRQREVMVGCSAFSEDGRTAGSRITEGSSPRCEAVSGSERYPGERGVIASAVCCRRR